MPDTPANAAKSRDTDLLFQSIRTYVDARIEEADKRYQERYEFSQRALEKADNANASRLDAMNEFRGTLADQAARLPTRSEVAALNDAIQTRVTMEIGPIKERIETLSKTNWPLFVSFFGIFVMLVGALWVVIGLKIDGTNQPVLVKLEAVVADNLQLNERLRVVETAAATSSQADAASRADRTQLNQRVAVVEDRAARGTADRLAADARENAALIEIETQFKSASIVMNLNQDHDEQLLSILYAKAFPGDHLPATDYRPQLNK